MFKKLMITTLTLLLSLGTLATVQPASAKSVYRSIPKSYRGTWVLRSPKANRGHKLVVHARSIKAAVIHLKGKRLGVHVGKGYVTVFQAHKGEQVGENFNLKRSHYKHHKALKITYDTQTEYYTK